MTATTRRLPAPACELGEGPHYDHATDTAFWFDIIGKRLWEHRFATGETLSWDLPCMGSVVARIDDRTQLLATEDGFYLRDRANGALTRLAALEADNVKTRSNDGRVHPSGRLWIGTMGKNAERRAGAIYLFDGRESRLLYPDISIPNSICFSPDGKLGYFTDTPVGTIWRVALDPATAMPLGEPEPFLQTSALPLGGHFDGSIVDADGVLWNAAWAGGSVSGFAPDGSLVKTFEVPAARTTCPCFVGPALDRMIITSAWEGYDATARAADPGAGLTYLVNGHFNGLANSAFKLPSPDR